MTESRFLSLRIAILLSIIAIGCDDGPYRGFGIKGGRAVFIKRGGEPGAHPFVRNLPADPASFSIVPPLPNATRNAHTYARDTNTVFIGTGETGFALADCDPATFVILSPDGKYSRDSSHVYYCGLPLKDADPKSFQILAPPFSKDMTHAYAGAASIDVLDAATFEVVMAGDSEFPLLNGHIIEHRDNTSMPTSIWGWARDSQAYYYADFRVKGADRDSFNVLGLLYAKDKDHVYWVDRRKVILLADADPATFQVGRSAADGWDKNFKYFQGKKTIPK